MAAHNDLGRYGEQMAMSFLLGKDYRILNQNWAYGRAEIDLIAFKDEKIIFVEVKTRRSAAHGEPEEFVNWKKEQQLEFASREYIARCKHQGEIRFDIIAIIFENKNTYKINHIEDAFWPG
jgi:putative endonuclease